MITFSMRAKGSMEPASDLISAHARTRGGGIFSQTLGRRPRKKDCGGGTAWRKTPLPRDGSTSDRTPPRQAETALLGRARQADALRPVRRELARDSPWDERKIAGRGRKFLGRQTRSP